LSKPESEAIEIPIPGSGGKVVKFTGANVFFVLLILAIGYLAFNQLGQVHDEIQKLREELVARSKEFNCKLDLDIYMYGRPPEQFRMRDMPRGLFDCLPKWVGETPETQIAPHREELDKK